MTLPASPSSRHRAPAFALVITLIMVTLAAVVAVALLTTATSERQTANSYSKRFRAEMAAQSGLAAALNALSGASGPSDFRYVTAVGDGANGTLDSKPALIPLTPPSAATGVVSLDMPKKRSLVSVAPAGGPNPVATPATLTLSSTSTTRITRQAGLVSLTVKDGAGVDQEAERYAFYIDEGGSRQNLVLQGGTPRIYARDPSELPLLTTAASPVPFTAQQTTNLKARQSVLFTLPTANLAMSPSPVTPPIDDYSYVKDSAVANLTPEGKPRVDLTKLKAYVDGLPVDQSSGNPRAALVDRLLNFTETGTDWNGGNLSILTKLTRYSGTQPKQIVANLLDYIDSDLIPTTDNVDSPTYFGVEGRADSTGKVVGHPFINFVGTGMVFNRSNAAGSRGGLNSTRVLVTLGIVNPWSLQTKDWGPFYVKPEIEIAITGTAAGGRLGPNAQSYFHSAFTTSDSLNQLAISPVTNILPNTGYSFPSPSSSVTNYANNFDILNTGGGRQPPGMVFSNLGFKIVKLRLKFTDTDGRSGYVQVLDGLSSVLQPANPSTVNMGNTGGSLTYKFTSGAPSKKDFHLTADPRLDFRSASWILALSAEDGTPVGTNPPKPQTAINIFAASDPQNWDYTGQAPTSTDSRWYTKTDVTSNFYVKSPATTGTIKLDSAGELGYLHTGIPWETLRFYVTGNERLGKERDRELLAYVQAGTFAASNYGTVSTHSGQGNPPTAIPSLAGPGNVNTNKRPTLQSLLLGATAVADSDATARGNGGSSDPDAATIADAIATNSAVSPFPLPGDILALSQVKSVTNAQTTDFNREILARRTANVLGTQSTRFTVYALGEARDKVGANFQTTSSVNLRAEVEFQTDANGKPVPHVLSTAYYTN